MMTLNKGKLVIGQEAGVPIAISYGNQSPEADTIALTWRVGDVRYYEGAGISHNSTWIKWICITAGTPGVWQLVRIPYALPILQVPFVYKGIYPDDGTERFMAPATADWDVTSEAAVLPNIYPVPRTPDLESTGEGPCFISLEVWITQNDWDTPTADGITVKGLLHDGTNLVTGSINANPAFTGKFSFAATLAAGIITSNAGLMGTLSVNPAAGEAGFKMTAILTLYRDFSALFPS